MRSPRILLVSAVLVPLALLSAACGPDEPEERPLPARANAATPLLRTYYQTQTTPKDMKAIKIPEGDAFDDDELSVEFDMSSTELVTDVSAGVTVGGGRDPVSYDLYMRMVSPRGTASQWKPVDVATGTIYYTKQEIEFNYEFDNEPANGTWKMQLRDPIKDNDGRLLFRNGTVRINDGEISTVRGLSNNSLETVTLTAAQARYDVLREVNAGPFQGDFGVYGIDAMLLNNFTFTTSFSVRTLTLNFVVYARDSAEAKTDFTVMIMSPSGNYIYGAVGDAQFSIDAGTADQLAYTFVLSSFMGEPSLGTWTVAVIDTKLDSNTMDLTDFGPTSASTLGTVPISITLAGRSYT